MVILNERMLIVYCADVESCPDFDEKVKGTSHDSIFQFSLFSTLADIFCSLETPPVY